jgi:aspartate kinase
MGIVVKKFGGTSVGSIEKIQNVAKLIKSYLKEHADDRVIVVVSAMSGETNKLIALAKSCVWEPEPRELDVLLATGEQVTIALTSMALIGEGIRAESLDAQQACISTDTIHTNAKITDINAARIHTLVKRGIVPVVAGFQGVDPEGDITTLGRGGSDITAVAVAAAVEAKACYIYTDVEGVYTADPRICSAAKKTDFICHEEMLEMASLGAKVLHPRSVYFALRYQVPLVVLSTFNPGKGTWIVKEEHLMESPIVTGITHRIDEAKITIIGHFDKVNSVSAIFRALAEENIFVDMISQSGFEKEPINLSFTVPEDVADKAASVCKLLGEDPKSELYSRMPGSGQNNSPDNRQAVEVDKNIAKVSIVGVGMKYHTGVAAKMFESLARENIQVHMISTSEIKCSVVIPRKYCEIAVRALHEAFIEYTPEVSPEDQKTSL